MSIITVLLFFVYTYGLGYSVTKFLKNSDNFLERNLMRVGIGLGIIPFLGILINFFHIPLDWKIFLIASMVVPLIDIFRIKSFPPFKFRLAKSTISILIVLVLFFASLFMYVSGAFKYPWLEDDDPWLHAEGVKYVAVEKDVFNPKISFMYINPYPPGYDLLFGILHQTSSSLYWTMKFFNALIISLGIIFFYFFAKRFIGNKNKALFATFVLASIPSYLSHFIWAHSLVITLFFPAMYCIEMLKKDKKWMYISMLVIASICLTQPTQAIKFMVLFGIYFLVKWIYLRRLDLRLLIALYGGYILSSIWWYNHFKPMFFSTRAGDFVRLEVEYGFFQKMVDFIKNAFPTASGTASRAYSFNDFVFAQHQNMINNPIGIGLFISLLLIISVIFLIIKYRRLLDKEKIYLPITLLLAIFTFLGINSVTFNLPIGFFAFRFWMLFAIPASILAAEGLWFLFSIGKKYKIIILIIVIIGILFTSAHQKYSVNTAVWGFGQGWTSLEEIKAYLWIKDNMPPNTKVFTFIDSAFVLGLDMYSCTWCSDVKEFQKTAFKESPDKLEEWLKSRGYRYLAIGGRESREFGVDKTNIKIKELIDSGLFNVAYSTSGAIVFNVV